MADGSRRFDDTHPTFVNHDRDLVSPVSMGEMLDDDALDKLCDQVLLDIHNEAPTGQT